MCSSGLAYTAGLTAVGGPALLASLYKVTQLRHPAVGRQAGSCGECLAACHTPQQAPGGDAHSLSTRGKCQRPDSWQNLYLYTPLRHPPEQQQAALYACSAISAATLTGSMTSTRDRQPSRLHCWVHTLIRSRLTSLLSRSATARTAFTQISAIWRLCRPTLHQHQGQRVGWCTRRAAAEHPSQS